MLLFTKLKKFLCNSFYMLNNVAYISKNQPQLRGLSHFTSLLVPKIFRCSRGYMKKLAILFHFHNSIFIVFNFFSFNNFTSYIHLSTRAFARMSIKLLGQIPVNYLIKERWVLNTIRNLFIIGIHTFNSWPSTSWT